MTRTWTVNGRFLTQPVSGVQRHAREVVAALDTLIGERHPFTSGLRLEIVAPRDALDHPSLRNIAIRVAGGLTGHAWEQVTLPREAPGGLLSLCNSGPVRHARHIACLHDANTRSAPHSYGVAFRLLYRVLMPALGRRCRVITTVSHFAAGELDRWRIHPRATSRVVANGHEHVLCWQPAHTSITKSVAGPRTIVVLGSPAVHKNVGLLVDLAPRLAEAGLTLAVAGLADGRVFAAPDAPTPTRGVNWLGRIDDAALGALLGDCLCLAFPSRMEGFGLPPLEAMALGCPVVVSDRASMPEICGEAALYASPDDAEEWLASLVRLAADGDLRERLAVAGRRRAATFTWRNVALRYLEAMADVDGMVTSERAATPVAYA